MDEQQEGTERNPRNLQTMLSICTNKRHDLKKENLTMNLIQNQAQPIERQNPKLISMQNEIQWDYCTMHICIRSAVLGSELYMYCLIIQ